MPPGPLPGASAGPSSGSSEDGSECDDWRHDPRDFAGLAPPRTARSVAAGVASLVTTKCVRTTWTPSSGARMLTSATLSKKGHQHWQP